MNEGLRRAGSGALTLNEFFENAAREIDEGCSQSSSRHVDELDTGAPNSEPATAGVTALLSLLEISSSRPDLEVGLSFSPLFCAELLQFDPPSWARLSAWRQPPSIYVAAPFMPDRYAAVLELYQCQYDSIDLPQSIRELDARYICWRDGPLSEFGQAVMIRRPSECEPSASDVHSIEQRSRPPSTSEVFVDSQPSLADWVARESAAMLERNGADSNCSISLDVFASKATDFNPSSIVSAVAQSLSGAVAAPGVALEVEFFLRSSRSLESVDWPFLSAPLPCPARFILSKEALRGRLSRALEIYMSRAPADSRFGVHSGMQVWLTCERSRGSELFRTYVTAVVDTTDL